MTNKGPWKPTGKEKLYKITKPFAKYARMEERDGKEVKMFYTGLDPRNPNWPSQLLLDDKKAEALRGPLRLVLVGDRPRIEVKDPVDSVPTPVVPAEDIVIPEDWKSLPADSRKALASRISGSEVTRVKSADAIIEQHAGA